MRSECDNDEAQFDQEDRRGKDDCKFIQVLISKVEIRDRGRLPTAESDSHKNLVESINKVGVLEPILVQQRGEDYILIAGERRLLACKEAGWEKVPARIYSQHLSQEDLVSIQMVENLQRENPDPITEAERYLKYFEVVMGVAGIDGATTVLVNHGRRQKKTTYGYAEKISALEAISGKTSRTIQNLLKLLKLPPEAQRAVIDKKISLSQGYILSTKTYDEKFDSILRKRLEHGRMTNEDLLLLFEDNQKSDLDEGSKQYRDDRKRLSRARLALERNLVHYGEHEKEGLRKEIEMLRSSLDAKRE